MDRQRRTGVLYAVSAYFLWGFTPIYWRLFPGFAPLQLLAHRIVWAFVLSILILALTGGLGNFSSTLRNRKQISFIILRTLLLALNWYVYIWAVGNGRVLEASLGYYLNPLVSILLGLLFLKERLNGFQWASVGFAVIGVGIKTAFVGSFPFVSVILAFSFGIYGLLKKTGTDSSMVGMGLESFILLPLAGAYLLYSEISGSGYFIEASFGMKLIFVSTGIITIGPLILFAKGTRQIPLTWIGFLQFIAPTMMLLFGIFVYHEKASLYDMLGFAFVWAGILMFLMSSRSKKASL